MNTSLILLKQLFNLLMEQLYRDGDFLLSNNTHTSSCSLFTNTFWLQTALLDTFKSKQNGGLASLGGCWHTSRIRYAESVQRSESLPSSSPVRGSRIWIITAFVNIYTCRIDRRVVDFMHCFHFTSSVHTGWASKASASTVDWKAQLFTEDRLIEVVVVFAIREWVSLQDFDSKATDQPWGADKIPPINDEEEETSPRPWLWWWWWWWWWRCWNCHDVMHSRLLMNSRPRRPSLRLLRGCPTCWYVFWFNSPFQEVSEKIQTCIRNIPLPTFKLENSIISQKKRYSLLRRRKQLSMT